MKTKEELKAIRDCLESHLDDFTHNGSDFQKGMIFGAIDALDWALCENKLVMEGIFSHCATIQSTCRPKKKIISKDYFGA